MSRLNDYPSWQQGNLSKDRLAGNTYKSSATISRQLGKYTESGVLVSGSNQATEAKYPTDTTGWTSVGGKLISPKNK